MKSSSHVLLACMQAQELADDDGIDKRPVRVRTARMFLDGFEAIQRGEAGLDVPIFAAMSPIDKVCCWLDLPAACCSGHPHIAEVQCSRRAMVWYCRVCFDRHCRCVFTCRLRVDVD